MPVLNGYEATSRIRKSSRNDNNIPIISLTADAFKDDVELISAQLIIIQQVFLTCLIINLVPFYV